MRVLAPLLLLFGFAAPAPAQSRREIDRAIAAVKPALVRILVAGVEYQQGREQKSESAGSGVIISPEGYVVTNHHVAGWAKRMLVTLADRTEAEADLVGTDPLTDISVLKLRPRTSKAYPFARWGDSSKLRVGDTVLAMGSPLALTQSVTQGIVSNTAMVMPDLLGKVDLSLDGEDVGSMVLWIGHDAQIHPGNSGGPLVNLAGEIVGINELEYGLAGAIPSNLARQVAQSLIERGKVVRADLGLRVQPLLKSQGRDSGALVSRVAKGSPAALAGLLPGDVLLSVGGAPTTVRFPEQVPPFNGMVASLPVGKPVEIEYEREGKRHKATAVPTERESRLVRPVPVRQVGIVVQDVTRADAEAMGRNSTEGAKVQSVAPGGPGGNLKPSLREGDVIVAVGNQRVRSAAEFRAAVESQVRPENMPLLFSVEFERGNEQIVGVVRVERLDGQDTSQEARKAYLGVSTQVLVPDLAKVLGVEGRKGFRVTGVASGSPAERAGLRVGDLILAVDDVPLDASRPEDAEELSETIRQYDIGATVVLRIWREGVQTVPVQLGASPLSARELRRLREEDFEFTVRDLTVQDRDARQLGGVSGVLVEDVAPGGWAALGKLSSGDVIVSVNGTQVADVEAFRKAMAEQKAKKTKFVVLRVLRGTDELFIEMEADWSASD
ncbi:MAG: PDZ domain-containing protein [Fimbriimonadales bacterium]|nr:PDZ domain-containing protein [Fimbriimonadales bacterium]